MKFNKQTIIFLFIIIAVTTIVKVICAPQLDLSGFSAGLSVALFAGFAEKDVKKALLLPLITVFFSDVLIQLLFMAKLFPFAGFYSNQWINYLLIASLTFMGMLLRNGKIMGILAASVLGPAFFFLVSNYIVWATQASTMGYANDFSGLITCYTAGIPFYRNSVIATLIFLPSFIGLYQWIVKGKFSLQFAK
ncbi:MAG TPA: hypothetical protein PLA68_01625 [Panacibacter sp.]|nr:hypothetical protein [Panacibacter sp.]